MSENVEYTKPPLGLIPKWLWEEGQVINAATVGSRVSDILAAMERFEKAGKQIPQEWQDELILRMDWVDSN
jgi:lipid A disaccharide synthetase